MRPRDCRKPSPFEALGAKSSFSRKISGTTARSGPADAYPSTRQTTSIAWGDCGGAANDPLLALFAPGVCKRPMRLYDSPTGGGPPENFGAIPALLSAAGVSTLEVECQNGRIVDQLHVGIDELKVSGLNLAAQCLVIAIQFIPSIDSLLDERVEVDDIRRGDFDEARGVTVTPSLESLSLHGNDWIGSVGVVVGHVVTIDQFNHNTWSDHYCPRVRLAKEHRPQPLPYRAPLKTSVPAAAQHTRTNGSSDMIQSALSASEVNSLLFVESPAMLARGR